jgi:hypothetical protein
MSTDTCDFALIHKTRMYQCTYIYTKRKETKRRKKVAEARFHYSLSLAKYAALPIVLLKVVT